MRSDRYEPIADRYGAAIARRVNDEHVRREIVVPARITARTRRILDAGCGEGSYIKAIAKAFPDAMTVGVDRSRSLIALAKRDAFSTQFLQADLESLPIRDGYFDLAYARFAVHHSKDLVGTLTEIARVTAPGGTFFFLDAHPISALFLKPSRDYETKEMARFRAWHDSGICIEHPSFTFSEYVQAIKATGWEILEVQEKYGPNSTSSEYAPYRIPTVLTFRLKRDR